MRAHRTIVTAVLLLAAASPACARLGALPNGLGAALRHDLAHGAARTPGAPGTLDVRAEGIALREFPIVLYRPVGVSGRMPGVVFLPGRFAPEDQYESYARALASHGMVVAVRGRYSWFHGDDTLTRDAIRLADWMRARSDVDSAHIAIAGHSMGGRDAIRAASRDPRFEAVVAIDPGTIENLPHATEVLASLHAPLLLIGADQAWRALEFCGRQGTNYTAYFTQAPIGTLELELHGADHVQVMDRPDDLGYSVCRAGTADSTAIRNVTRSTVVQFLRAKLQGEHVAALPDFGALATWRRRDAIQTTPATGPDRSNAIASSPMRVEQNAVR
jgi:dienelactone hydrolase